MSRLLARLVLITLFVLGQSAHMWTEAFPIAYGGAAQSVAAGATDGDHGFDEQKSHQLHICPYASFCQSVLPGRETAVIRVEDGAALDLPFDTGFLRSAVLERDPPVPKSLA